MKTASKIPSANIPKKAAYKFVILIGIVSLFADMTYEGARSITGPFLSILGANAAIVGFVAGFGELMGYVVRLFSGYFADRTGKYWTITIIGYALNLLVVPLLALAGHWWEAAVLIILERVGRAIRVPSRDVMLSQAGHRIGLGFAFGLHEALDQTGAMIGPLIVATVLYFKGGYQESFAILLIPALLALSVLLFARRLYPNPEILEMKSERGEVKGITLPFWIYLAGASFIAAGYADFSLMAYHFQKSKVLSTVWIPASYSMAMGVNILTAPLFGHYYDKRGFGILIFVTIISSLFAPLVFLGDFKMALIGIILWSIGVGAHESLMRAIVVNMVSRDNRGFAYGIFNTGYGIFWFLGSFLMGILYDISIPKLVIFSIVIQLLAVPLLWVVMFKINRSKKNAIKR